MSVNITSNNFEELLQLLQNYYEPNILEYYDNVTYNIRFYMLNSLFQSRYSIERKNNNLNGFEIPDDEKIIIVETGVSDNYSIDSLTINNIHSCIYKNPSALTYNMEMIINENNGCSLGTKIAAVSKVLGYDGYIGTPFHIDIWFSGYENATGLPIKIIKDGDENLVLSYEVILSEVKTSVDNNGAKYNFIMTPSYQGCFSKQEEILNKIGEIVGGAGNTYGSYITKIIEYINERFDKDNPLIKDDYIGEENRYMILGKFKEGSITNYDNILRSLYDKKQRENKTASGILTNNAILSQLNNDESEFHNMIFNAKINSFISPQSDDVQQIGKIREDATVTLSDFIQEMCFHSSELKNYIARPRFIPIYKEAKNGTIIKQIQLDIVFTYNNYMEYYQKRKDGYSVSDNIEHIKDREIKELKEMILNRTVRKRYEWQYNGRDTSVLEFNTSFDKLWYANIGTENILNKQESSNDIVLNVKETDVKEKLLNAYNQKADNIKDLKELLRYTNQRYDNIRHLTSDKRLYLDDIFYCLDKNTVYDLIKLRKIYEKNDSLFDANSETQTSDMDIETTLAKVGYENIHSSGTLVDLDMTILGDPFWLGLSSDKIIYSPENIGNILNNFAFRIRPTLELTSEGTYSKPEEDLEFSNLYMLVESTSLFQNGKFTQKLKGVINPSFINRARIGV